MSPTLRHIPCVAKAVEEALQPMPMRYVDMLQQHMLVLERALTMLVGQGLHGALTRASLQAEARALAGTGSIYGFPKISEAARPLENALACGLPDDDPVLLDLVARLMAVCHQAIALSAGASSLERAPQTRLPVLLALGADDITLDEMHELFEDDARVLTSRHAIDALHLIKTHRVDMVLVDDMMPGGVKGATLIACLRSVPGLEDLPCILMVDEDRLDEVVASQAVSILDCVVKPLDTFSLIAKVRTRLWRRQARIVVADDDEAVRDMLMRKLRGTGCDVSCAADGLQAWDMLQQQKVSLAVLDLTMPGYDGMTLLKMMKSDDKLSAVPVVFLSAKHMGPDALEGLNMGAADCITKPFNANEVLTRCARLLQPPARRLPV